MKFSQFVKSFLTHVRRAIARPRRRPMVARAAIVGELLDARQMLSAVYVDFDKHSSATADGYESIERTTRYPSATGGGWLDGPIESFDARAGSADDVRRDFHFARSGQRTFRVDLPNGTYDVTPIIGSPTHTFRKVKLALNGQQVATVTTKPGQFHSETYRVDVSDGWLDVSIARGGGSLFGIAGLKVQVVDSTPVNNPPSIALSSVVTSISEQTNTAERSLVAGIVVTDDNQGTAQLSLSGPDAGLFEIDGTDLFLRAGTSLSAADNPLLEVTVSVDDPAVGTTPDDSASLTIRVTAAETASSVMLAYDFDKHSSATADGYESIERTTRYPSATGGGWLDGPIESFDARAGSADDVRRDIHFARSGQRTFRVDLPNGTYDVTPIIGSPTHTFRKVKLALNGQQVATVTTKPGQFHSETYRVDVSDGWLDVSIARGGGSLFGIAGLKVQVVDSTPVNNPPSIALSSVVTSISEQTNTAERSLVAGIVVTDDNQGTAQLSLSGPDAGLFEIDGTDLFLRAGTSLSAADNPLLEVTVSVDDSAVGTTPDDSASLTIRVTAAETASSVMLAYDFDKHSSATADGYESIERTTRYPSATGGGWLDGPIESFDARAGSADDVRRDIHFARSGQRTFRVDLPNGTYDVTPIIGSPTHTFRKVKLALNGQQVATVTTKPGQFHSETYRVNVSEGWLDVSIARGGGSLFGIAGLKVQVVGNHPDAESGRAISGPDAIVIDEDTVAVFSVAEDSRLLIRHPDPDDVVRRATLIAEHGRITLGSLSSIVLIEGTGIRDRRVTIEGSVRELNRAIDGLQFTPDKDFHGDASLALIIADNGTSDGVQHDIAITVESVNDRPSFFTGDTQRVLQGSGVHVSPNWATSIDSGADNESDQKLSFTISTDNPSLFEIPPYIEADTGDLSFKPAVDQHGTAEVFVRLEEQSNNGLGSRLHVLTIHVAETQTVVPTLELIPEDSGVRVLFQHLPEHMALWITGGHDFVISLPSGSGEFFQHIDWSDRHRWGVGHPKGRVQIYDRYTETFVGPAVAFGVYRQHNSNNESVLRAQLALSELPELTHQIPVPPDVTPAVAAWDWIQSQRDRLTAGEISGGDVVPTYSGQISEDGRSIQLNLVDFPPGLRIALQPGSRDSGLGALSFVDIPQGTLNIDLMVPRTDGNMAAKLVLIDADSGQRLGTDRGLSINNGVASNLSALPVRLTDLQYPVDGVEIPAPVAMQTVVPTLELTPEATGVRVLFQHLPEHMALWITGGHDFVVSLPSGSGEFFQHIDWNDRNRWNVGHPKGRVQIYDRYTETFVGPAVAFGLYRQNNSNNESTLRAQLAFTELPELTHQIPVPPDVAPAVAALDWIQSQRDRLTAGEISGGNVVPTYSGQISEDGRSIQLNLVDFPPGLRIALQPGSRDSGLGALSFVEVPQGTHNIDLMVPRTDGNVAAKLVLIDVDSRQRFGTDRGLSINNGVARSLSALPVRLTDLQYPVDGAEIPAPVAMKTVVPTLELIPEATGMRVLFQHLPEHMDLWITGGHDFVVSLPSGSGEFFQHIGWSDRHRWNVGHPKGRMRIYDRHTESFVGPSVAFGVYRQHNSNNESTLRAQLALTELPELTHEIPVPPEVTPAVGALDWIQSQRDRLTVGEISGGNVVPTYSGQISEDGRSIQLNLVDFPPGLRIELQPGSRDSGHGALSFVDIPQGTHNIDLMVPRTDGNVAAKLVLIDVDSGQRFGTDRGLSINNGVARSLSALPVRLTDLQYPVDGVEIPAPVAMQTVVPTLELISEDSGVRVLFQHLPENTDLWITGGHDFVVSLPSGSGEFFQHIDWVDPHRSGVGNPKGRMRIYDRYTESFVGPAIVFGPYSTQGRYRIRRAQLALTELPELTHQIPVPPEVTPAVAAWDWIQSQRDRLTAGEISGGNVVPTYSGQISEDGRSIQLNLVDFPPGLRIELQPGSRDSGHGALSFVDIPQGTHNIDLMVPRTDGNVAAKLVLIDVDSGQRFGTDRGLSINNGVARSLSALPVRLTDLQYPVDGVEIPAPVAMQTVVPTLELISEDSGVRVLFQHLPENTDLWITGGHDFVVSLPSGSGEFFQHIDWVDPHRSGVGNPKGRMRIYDRYTESFVGPAIVFGPYSTQGRYRIRRAQLALTELPELTHQIPVPPEVTPAVAAWDWIQSQRDRLTAGEISGGNVVPTYSGQISEDGRSIQLNLVDFPPGLRIELQPGSRDSGHGALSFVDVPQGTHNIDLLVPRTDGGVAAKLMLIDADSGQRLGTDRGLSINNGVAGNLSALPVRLTDLQYPVDGVEIPAPVAMQTVVPTLELIPEATGVLVRTTNFPKNTELRIASLGKSIVVPLQSGTHEFFQQVEWAAGHWRRSFNPRIELRDNYSESVLASASFGHSQNTGVTRAQLALTELPELTREIPVVVPVPQWAADFFNSLDSETTGLRLSLPSYSVRQSDDGMISLAYQDFPNGMEFRLSMSGQDVSLYRKRIPAGSGELPIPIPQTDGGVTAYAEVFDVGTTRSVGPARRISIHDGRLTASPISLPITVSEAQYELPLARRGSGTAEIWIEQINPLINTALKLHRNHLDLTSQLARHEHESTRQDRSPDPAQRLLLLRQGMNRHQDYLAEFTQQLAALPTTLTQNETHLVLRLTEQAADEAEYLGDLVIRWEQTASAVRGTPKMFTRSNGDSLTVYLRSAADSSRLQLGDIAAVEIDHSGGTGYERAVLHLSNTDAAELIRLRATTLRLYDADSGTLQDVAFIDAREFSQPRAVELVGRIVSSPFITNSSEQLPQYQFETVDGDSFFAHSSEDLQGWLNVDVAVTGTALPFGTRELLTVDSVTAVDLSRKVEDLPNDEGLLEQKLEESGNVVGDLSARFAELSASFAAIDDTSNIASLLNERDQLLREAEAVRTSRAGLSIELATLAPRFYRERPQFVGAWPVTGRVAELDIPLEHLAGMLQLKAWRGTADANSITVDPDWDDLSEQGAVELQGSVAALDLTKVNHLVTGLRFRIAGDHAEDRITAEFYRDGDMLQTMTLNSEGIATFEDREGITGVVLFSSRIDGVIRLSDLSIDGDIHALQVEVNSVSEQTIRRIGIKGAPQWESGEDYNYIEVAAQHNVHPYHTTSRRKPELSHGMRRLNDPAGDPSKYRRYTLTNYSGAGFITGVLYVNESGVYPLPEEYYTIVNSKNVIIHSGAPHITALTFGGNGLFSVAYLDAEKFEDLAPPEGVHISVGILMLYAQPRDDQGWTDGVQDVRSQKNAVGGNVRVLANVSNFGSEGGEIILRVYNGYTGTPSDPLQGTFQRYFRPGEVKGLSVNVSAAPPPYSGARPTITFVATLPDGSTSIAQKQTHKYRSMDRRVYNEKTGQLDFVSREYTEDELERLYRIRVRDRRAAESRGDQSRDWQKIEQDARQRWETARRVAIENSRSGELPTPDYAREEEDSTGLLEEFALTTMTLDENALAADESLIRTLQDGEIWSTELRDPVTRGRYRISLSRLSGAYVAGAWYTPEVDARSGVGGAHGEVSVVNSNEAAILNEFAAFAKRLSGGDESVTFHGAAPEPENNLADSSNALGTLFEFLHSAGAYGSSLLNRILQFDWIRVPGADSQNEQWSLMDKQNWLDAQRLTRTYFTNEPGTNIDELEIPPWLDAAQFFDDIEAAYTKEHSELTASDREKSFSRQPTQILGNRSQPVNAQFFVIHDTAGISQFPTREAVPANARGAHLFLGPDALLLNLDWHEAGSATKLEGAGTNTAFVHVELSRAGSSSEWPKSSNTLYTDRQYNDLANAYLVASLRRGSFLTITTHREVDRGIAGGHSDPREFDIDRLYRIIARKAGLPEGTTFGITQSRHDIDTWNSDINQFWSFRKGETPRVNQFGPRSSSTKSIDVWDTYWTESWDASSWDSGESPADTASQIDGLLAGPRGENDAELLAKVMHLGISGGLVSAEAIRQESAAKPESGVHDVHGIHGAAPPAAPSAADVLALKSNIEVLEEIRRDEQEMFNQQIDSLKGQLRDISQKELAGDVAGLAIGVIKNTGKMIVAANTRRVSAGEAVKDVIDRGFVSPTGAPVQDAFVFTFSAELHEVQSWKGLIWLSLWNFASPSYWSDVLIAGWKGELLQQTIEDTIFNLEVTRDMRMASIDRSIRALRDLLPDDQ